VLLGVLFQNVGGSLQRRDVAQYGAKVVFDGIFEGTGRTVRHAFEHLPQAVAWIGLHAVLHRIHPLSYGYPMLIAMGVNLTASGVSVYSGQDKELIDGIFEDLPQGVRSRLGSLARATVPLDGAQLELREGINRYPLQVWGLLATAVALRALQQTDASQFVHPAAVTAAGQGLAVICGIAAGDYFTRQI
jgi:hypothetical protein